MYARRVDKMQRRQQQQPSIPGCPICLEQFAPGMTDVSACLCGHTYHESCIDTWLRRCYGRRETPTCPECRKETPWESVHQLYFNFLDGRRGGEEKKRVLDLIAAKDSEMKALRSVSTAQQEEIQRMDRYVKTMSQQYANLGRSYSEATSELAAKLKELVIAKKKNDDKREELREATKKIQGLEICVEILEQNLERESLSKHKFEVDLAAKSRALQNLEIEMNVATKELSVMKKTMVAKQMSDIKAIEAKRKMNEMKRETTDAKKAASDLTAELADKKRRLESSVSFFSWRLGIESDQNATLREERDKLRKERDQLMDDLAAKDRVAKRNEVALSLLEARIQGSAFHFESVLKRLAPYGGDREGCGSRMNAEECLRGGNGRRGGKIGEASRDDENGAQESDRHGDRNAEGRCGVKRRDGGECVRECDGVGVGCRRFEEMISELDEEISWMRSRSRVLNSIRSKVSALEL